MSPQVLALLQRIDRNCKRSFGTADVMGAIYPRDYHRPFAQVKRNRWILPMYTIEPTIVSPS